MSDVESLYASMTVSDLTRSEEWYTAVFGGGPDARPMDGLLEWHFGDTTGFQVFEEPERSGASTMVVGVISLDEVVARLDDADITHDAKAAATFVAILPVTDPDGNRVVFTEDLPED